MRFFREISLHPWTKHAQDELDIHKTSWTSAERFTYVRFAWCVLGVISERKIMIWKLYGLLLKNLNLNLKFLWDLSKTVAPGCSVKKNSEKFFKIHRNISCTRNHFLIKFKRHPCRVAFDLFLKIFHWKYSTE